MVVTFYWVWQWQRLLYTEQKVHDYEYFWGYFCSEDCHTKFINISPKIIMIPSVFWYKDFVICLESGYLVFLVVERKVLLKFRFDLPYKVMNNNALHLHGHFFKRIRLSISGVFRQKIREDAWVVHVDTMIGQRVGVFWGKGVWSVDPVCAVSWVAMLGVLTVRIGAVLSTWRDAMFGIFLNVS